MYTTHAVRVLKPGPAAGPGRVCAQRREKKEEHHEPFTQSTPAGAAVCRRPAGGSHDGQLYPGGLRGRQ